MASETGATHFSKNPTQITVRLVGLSTVKLELERVWFRDKMSTIRIPAFALYRLPHLRQAPAPQWQTNA